MFSPRPTPVRVTAAAALKLPRWVFFGLLTAFILPGLFSREPWLDDAAGFGIGWTMATGHPPDWWLLNVAGAPVAEKGPLTFWLLAAAIRGFGDLLGAPLASRLICVIAYAISTSAIWYSTLRLCRMKEAQPVSLVFGGEADSRDYGRLIADIAVLLLIGTLGLVTHVHETTAETFALSASCVVFYGLVRSLDRGVSGAVIAGLAMGALGLSRGPLIALGPAIACAISWFWVHRFRRRMRAAHEPLRVPASAPDLYEAATSKRPAVEHPPALLTAIALTLALIVMAAWPLGAYLVAPEVATTRWFELWSNWLRDSTGLIGGPDMFWLGRNASWQLWPLWPLGAIGLHAWRHNWQTPHVAVPTLTCAGVLTATLFSSPITDAAFLPMIAPLAVLAAYGVSTLRRTLENVVDWFSLAVFSLFLLFVWAYWIAVMLGVPRAMATSVMRLTPGFGWRFDAMAFAVAAVVSIGWVATMGWRILRPPEPLWRGPVVSAAGLTALWIVVVALFLPGVNYNRSHSALAHNVSAQIIQSGHLNACVQAHRVPPAYRALMAFYGDLRFGREDSAEACAFALHRDTSRSRFDDEPPPGGAVVWQLAWEGRRAGRPDEVWRLWRRVGS